MKTLSFFNEKGGVGKSLHTVMFASWLQYAQGARVAVFDLECPSPRLDGIRRRELVQLEDPDSVLSRYFLRHPRPESFFDIFTKEPLLLRFSRENIYALHRELWDFLDGNPGGYDYVLFDFPGILTADSPAYDVIASGMVDLVAVPIDTDNVTRKSGLVTACMAQDNEQRAVAFWNNVSPAEIARPGYLESGERVFTEHGIEVLPQRVKTFLKARRDSDERLFVRSTVCWPGRYVEMACPGLESLYMTIKGRVDSVG